MNQELEWLDELESRWTDIYKKSVTTLLLLRVVKDRGTVTTTQIGEELERRSGWRISERALYRTLQRLASSGFLRVTTSPVPRSGLQRNEFAITDFGQKYLARIESVYARTKLS